MAQPIIWKEITTAFEGRAIGGSWAASWHYGMQRFCSVNPNMVWYLAAEAKMSRGLPAIVFDPAELGRLIYPGSSSSGLQFRLASSRSKRTLASAR